MKFLFVLICYFSAYFNNKTNNQLKTHQVPNLPEINVRWPYIFYSHQILSFLQLHHLNWIACLVSFPIFSLAFMPTSHYHWSKTLNEVIQSHFEKKVKEKRSVKQWQHIGLFHVSSLNWWRELPNEWRLMNIPKG